MALFNPRDPNDSITRMPTKPMSPPYQMNKRNSYTDLMRLRGMNPGTVDDNDLYYKDVLRMSDKMKQLYDNYFFRENLYNLGDKNLTARPTYGNNTNQPLQDNNVPVNPATQFLTPNIFSNTIQQGAENKLNAFSSSLPMVPRQDFPIRKDVNFGTPVVDPMMYAGPNVEQQIPSTNSLLQALVMSGGRKRMNKR